MNTLKMFNLEGKVAIVTGGAGYFGKPITIGLAEAGALVIVASRDGQKCRQFAAEMQSEGLLVEGEELDLGDEQSIHDFTKLVCQKYGKIDVLINNAVSRAGFKNLDVVTGAEWEESQRINSTGLMLISQAVVKIMVAQNSGSIINIGSIQGAVGPNFPVYGSTGMTSPVNYTYDKWGMVGLTKWMANYYGKHNIRVNCISPGGYGPGVAESIGETEFVSNYKQMTPLGRFAEDDDIKGPVVFFASEASAYITGHHLLVDGGWTNW